MKKSRLKRISLYLLILCLLVFLTPFLCYYKVKFTDNPIYYQEGLSKAPKADLIIVPGSGITFDGPGLYLKHRLTAAIRLYRSGKAGRILVSGAFDPDTGLHEAEVMKDYLINEGIPASDIYMDTEGIDTYTTMKRAGMWAPESAVYICTQEIYMKRALYLAEHSGLKAAGMSSDLVIYSVHPLKNNLREFLACTKAIKDTVFNAEVKGLKDTPIKAGDAK